MISTVNHLAAFISPEHCDRAWSTPWDSLWPWLSLLLQSALLFHTPQIGPAWLMRDHARPLRLLMLPGILVLCWRLALAYNGSNVNMFGYQGQCTALLLGLFGVHLSLKAIELAWLSAPPTLAHSDEDVKKNDRIEHKSALANGNGTSQRVGQDEVHRPARPFYFPHTPMPLFIEFVLALRGVGWSWGVPSKAGYGYGPRTELPPTKLSDPKTIRFLCHRILVAFICIAGLDLANNIVTHPLYLSVFETYPSPLAPRTPFDTSVGWDGGLWSQVRKCAAEIILTLVMGMCVVGPIQGGFAVMSVLSTLLSPKTQTSWDPLLFGNPLKSTSLAGLWSKEWHAIFRRSWYVVGYLPARTVARKAGLSKTTARNLAIMATFTVSGLMHETGQHSIRMSRRLLDARTGETQNLTMMRDSITGRCYPVDSIASGFGAQGFANLRFFLLQGVGIFLEQAFSRLTGKQVRGPLGTLWVACWVGLTVQSMLRSWLHHGLMDDGMFTTPVFKGLADVFVRSVVKMGGGDVDVVRH